MIKELSKNVYEFNFENEGSIVYLIKINNKNILIDTSSKENKEKLIDHLTKLSIKPKEINIIILTHAHYDHLENIELFSNAKIYSNFKEKIESNHKKTILPNLNPIEKLSLKEFKIYKTPGHTENDIVLLYKNILFSGDVIFNQGYIGRTDFPESLPEKMKESLEFISKLKFDILCPGH